MKKVVEVEVPDFNEEWLNLIDTRLSALERKVDSILEGMSTLANVISNMSKAIETETPKVIEEVKYIPRDKWKERIRDLSMDVLNADPRFSKRIEVMNYVFEYIRKNYGICWEQEQKDYKARDGVPGIPSFIDTANANDTLRSLVEAVLMDMAERAQREEVYVPKVEPTIDDIIAPLIERTNDVSKYHMLAFRHVYKQMEEVYGVHWDNRTTRYENKTGKHPYTRKEIIANSESLKKKFSMAVNDLLRAIEE